MSVTGSQINLANGEVEKIITDDQADRTYLVEVTGANDIRVSHNKRYAADGTTLSSGQTHTVSNLRRERLYAAAYNGSTALRVREASADVQSQPEKEVSIIDGDVTISDSLDVSNRSGREIGKARLENSTGTLIDPATDNTLSSELSREIASWSAGEIPVNPSGTDPLTATDSGTGSANAAVVDLGSAGGRSVIDIGFDTTGAATLTVEVSTDQNTWYSVTGTPDIGSAVSQVFQTSTGMRYVRAYLDSNRNKVEISAKGI